MKKYFRSSLHFFVNALVFPLSSLKMETLPIFLLKYVTFFSWKKQMNVMVVNKRHHFLEGRNCWFCSFLTISRKKTMWRWRKKKVCKTLKDYFFCELLIYCCLLWKSSKMAQNWRRFRYTIIRSIPIVPRCMADSNM